MPRKTIAIIAFILALLASFIYSIYANKSSATKWYPLVPTSGCVPTPLIPSNVPWSPLIPSNVPWSPLTPSGKSWSPLVPTNVPWSPLVPASCKWIPLTPSSKIITPIYGNEIITCKGSSFLTVDSVFVAQRSYSITMEFKTNRGNQFLFGTDDPLGNPSTYMMLILRTVRVDYVDKTSLIFAVKTSDGEKTLLLSHQSDSFTDGTTFTRCSIERNETSYAMKISDEIVSTTTDILPRTFSAGTKFYVAGRPFKKFIPSVDNFAGCVRFIRLNGDGHVAMYPDNPTSFTVGAC